jgi:hypothetical protein
VHICSHPVEDRVPKLGSIVDRLRGAKNGDHFVATVEVQVDSADARTIETPLIWERIPHETGLPRDSGHSVE